MQCYTELVPPAGVTQAIALPFTSDSASNLIIGRTSILQIFTHKQVNNAHDTKLVLVAEYNLSGTIIALGRVKTPNSKSGGDALLVSFRDAKLSLIEWDPFQHSISTISIHYYENYNQNTAPWMPVPQDCVNILTVDPGSRCAAYNFGITNLAIIPFYQEKDDLAMDDFDDVEDNNEEKVQFTQTNGKPAEQSTPYAPSFVLPLTMLDPNIMHPIDMAFLHEYRDSTIAILFSSVARSENMAYERKDVVTYAVYALELEQKASTTLQSVQNLPNDLNTIIPLPLPVGGSLLVGSNELIHIDQGGKSSAIAVNEFAREASSFPMADHAGYQLKLEGCQIQGLQNSSGDMLIVLATGEMAILSFRMDGRSVSGMSLRRADVESTKDVVRTGASCTAALGLGRVFVGSEDSSSILLGTSKRQSQLKRQTSRPVAPNGDYATGKGNGTLDEDSGSDGDDFATNDDDDDLYADITSTGMNGNLAEAHAPASSIRLLDQLPCVAPLTDVAFGRSLKRKRENEDEDNSSVVVSSNKLDLAVACGRGQAGGVALFSRRFTPSVSKLIRRGNALAAWCFTNEITDKDSGQDNINDHIILSEEAEDDSGQSSLWAISEGEIQFREGTEFESSAGATLEVGRLLKTNHTVQVMPTEVRVYDSDFGLSQIFPIVDEEEGQMSKAIRASFADPYLVILKDDNKILLLKADKAGELDELDLPKAITTQTITSTALYVDNNDYFQSARYQKKGSAAVENILLSFLTTSGSLCILPLANPAVQIFQVDHIDFLPTYLAQDSHLPKHWRNKDELFEAVIADLGDATDQRPHLLIRNTTGDICIYQPFAVPGVFGTYRFRKVAHRNEEIVQQNNSEPSILPMQILKDLSGYAMVFVPGDAPKIIMKQAFTIPRIYDFGHEGVKSLCSLTDEVYGHDMLFVNLEGDICIAAMPTQLILGYSDWLVEKVDLKQEVTAISYFEPTQSYVLGVNTPTEFQLPQDDEWHQDWQNENARLLPTIPQSSLKLMSAATNSIISQYHFEQAERILCVKTMNLEVSEESHERKELIVVGTAVTKGENIVTRGNLYIFDVVDVVPQPGIPETNLKLKMISREDVRGAVTAISEVGSQGFILAAQGQKCMVRGLKEDMSILPVAFVDMQYYVSIAKELRGTGLCVLGDAYSGMWLMGYSEEPYKLQLLGRDLDNPPVCTAEFLPDGKQLFIITSDGDGQLRVLQFDPEDPKAERGTKLLQRSTFNSGAFPTTMTLLPRIPVSSEIAEAKSSRPPYASDDDDDSMSIEAQAQSTNYATNQILVTTQEGSIALITPLSDATYRRLSTLQNMLITSLDHPCGLNPRAYREVETDGLGGRGMIDGNLVSRWLLQSSQHKTSTADRVGGTIWDVRGDLESVGGGGLGFL